jgi:RPA family protein
MRKRMTAVRASISDVVNGTFGEDNGPHVTSSYGVELRRVVIVGFVVSKFNKEPDSDGGKRFMSMTLDDGTVLLEGVKEDILALVIGKIRKYEDEIYLVPEIVKEITDPNYMGLHLLERYQAILTRSGVTMASTVDEGQQQLTQIVGGPSPDSLTGLTKQILSYIELHATPKGVNLKDIVAFFEEKGKDAIEIQTKIFKLIEDGFINEITPSCYLPASV